MVTYLEKTDLGSYSDTASIGKVFPICTLALMAIDKGMLSLDDTLEEFFRVLLPTKRILP